MIIKTFSIIIPTYKRPEKLKNCLTSLINLKFDESKFEVIVVNDTIEQGIDLLIVNCFSLLLNLKIINQKNQGPAAARNTGAQAAQGKYLLFTDDDCTLSPYCLHFLEIYFKLSPNTLIGGKCINPDVYNIFSESSEEIVSYLYSYYNQRENKRFATTNFAVERKEFLDLKGFDNKFYLAGGEDWEFCDRWHHSGRKMIYAPEIIIYHNSDLDLKKFLKQQFNYGRGGYLFKKNKKEPINFYINLLIHPIITRQGKEKILIGLLFLTSQICIKSGVIYEAFITWHRQKSPA